MFIVNQLDSRILKKWISLLLLFFFILPDENCAQVSPKSMVKGTIFDSTSASPLGYASIRIFNSDSKKLVNGNLATDSGYFEIEMDYGSYYAEIEFMGYQSYLSASFSISKDNPVKDMGLIRLRHKAGTLGEVVVHSEKSSMQLALDKKVFNVGADLVNSGGTASDVLNNIPSVQVDPEGIVKLRGSNNVRILIDGKPSALVSVKGGIGLQQLQASMVERVEIITNPSARYEAEGMAGIINIILKKDRRQGFNGTIELVGGDPLNLGAAFNLNYRHKKINFFINYGVTYRKAPYKGSIYQEVYEPDTTWIFKQRNSGTLSGFNNLVRAGIDYYFTEKSILTGSYMNRRLLSERTTDIKYEDYLFNASNLTRTSARRQEEDETEPNSEVVLSYKKSFARKDHELIAEIKYLDYWENSDQVFTQSYYQPDGTEEVSKAILQRSINDEFEKQWLFQLDYVKPFGEDGKFETGIRSSFRNMVNDYLVTQEDSIGNFVPLPGLDNVFVYDENIHAAYGIISNRIKKISYQAGLRAEWTDVTTELEKTNEVNPRDYFNFFPSAHITMHMKKENGLQLSYSRRVRRPFYNDLSPYVTYSDSRNFFSGNPDLNPEYSDVLELGHIKSFDKGTITSAIYYRGTTDKIERIRTVDTAGNSVTLPENLSSEKAFGIEFIGGYTAFKWWKMDLNLNFFHADIDGTNIVPDYKASTYSWFVRQTSRFIFARNFDMQLRLNYEAPQKTVQGERKQLFYADFAASKDVLKGNGTVTLNVMDLFNSRWVRTISEGGNFYTDSNFQFRRRQINLTVSYRIRQSKQAPKPKILEE